ncbi:unnamed protein product [Caenorhabditis auriculariae]|uniref:Beta-galactosidase n=1 Tax=Caenorhabditis auriculariae TaxID=2777116 RepID=A0A8S1HER2_9PELO|nr:unnamed protein product [Caenorhabditis auriculariae]
MERPLLLMALFSLLVVGFGWNMGNPHNEGPSFRIDSENRQFLLDGKPFRYISGSIHYFRIPLTMWNDRLKKVRALGFNAIQFYIPWNLHEFQEGKFDFKGRAGELDFLHFVDLARQNGLWTLLRLGPYICGEWENGGLPYWLLRKGVQKQRSSDQIFKQSVANWFEALLQRVKPALRKNGGPILMLQIENEYGSYDACDRSYTTWLRDFVKERVGDDVVLYTTDGSAEDYLKCGAVPGVLPTVDFGTTSNNSNIDKYFEVQRKYAPYAPLVNSEFYPGWLLLWGAKSESLPTAKEIVFNAQYMYDIGANINFYMIHGGTNFGFWNGAEVQAPCLTSYDYGAPISEAGDVTPKYLEIRKWIKSLPDWPNKPLDVPENTPKAKYGRFELKKAKGVAGFADPSCVSSKIPLTHEEINQPLGYVIYRTKIEKCGELFIPKFADFAYVFVEEEYVGTLYRHYYEKNSTNITLTGCRPGMSALSIMVENQGRQTYETINDHKGILSEVFIDGQIKRDWTQCRVDLAPQNFYKYFQVLRDPSPNPPGDLKTRIGTFVGELVVSGKPRDTWIDTRGWGKGVVIVNSHNIGRYWATEGPQMTLYVPAEFLKYGPNLVVFVEVQGAHEACETGLCFSQSLDAPIFSFNSTLNV